MLLNIHNDILFEEILGLQLCSVNYLDIQKEIVVQISHNNYSRISAHYSLHRKSNEEQIKDEVDKKLAQLGFITNDHSKDRVLKVMRVHHLYRRIRALVDKEDIRAKL